MTISAWSRDWGPASLNSLIMFVVPSSGLGGCDGGGSGSPTLWTVSLLGLLPTLPVLAVGIQTNE